MKTKRIGIEAQRIFRVKKHGMDFVALECIRLIQQLDKQNEYFIFIGPGEDRCLEETANLHLVQMGNSNYLLWEQFDLPKAIKQYQVDFIHCTSNTAPLFCPVPLMLTLHDIIFLEPRQSRSASLHQELGWYYRKWVVPHILKKCKQIVTVSNFENQHITDFLQLSSSLVKTVYNGYNPYFRKMEDELAVKTVVEKYIASPNYLFYLGNTDPKKNTPRTLVAYSNYLKESTQKHPLLIADLSKEYIEKIAKEQNVENILEFIVCPGYIENKDLAAIYNGAFAFLYPSLRESFGIPMLEAMACGIPVLIGNTSAMPEVAGEGALSIDPFDPDDIKTKLIELEEDSNLYVKQVNYGLERVKDFSWEKSARALLELYEKM